MLEVSGKIAGEESRAIDLKRKGIIERIAKRKGSSTQDVLIGWVSKELPNVAWSLKNGTSHAYRITWKSVKSNQNMESFKSAVLEGTFTYLILFFHSESITFNN